MLEEKAYFVYVVGELGAWRKEKRVGGLKKEEKLSCGSSPSSTDWSE